MYLGRPSYNTAGANHPGKMLCCNLEIRACLKMTSRLDSTFNLSVCVCPGVPSIQSKTLGNPSQTERRRRCAETGIWFLFAVPAVTLMKSLNNSTKSYGGGRAFKTFPSSARVFLVYVLLVFYIYLFIYLFFICAIFNGPSLLLLMFFPCPAAKKKYSFGHFISCTTSL